MNEINIIDMETLLLNIGNRTEVQKIMDFIASFKSVEVIPFSVFAKQNNLQIELKDSLRDGFNYIKKVQMGEIQPQTLNELIEELESWRTE